MKKDLFRTFAAAAMSVMAIACAKEPAVEAGGEAGVSFSIEVPGAPETKAAVGDGETATKLYYQVFDGTGAPVDGLGVQSTALSGKTATVKFQLVKDQTYSFVFWAQTASDGYYTIDGTEGLKKISANYTGKSANDENFDAFYAVKTMTVTGPVSEAVKLKRPFAQINIATAGRISAGTAEKDIDFTDAASTVTVKGIPTVFSPLATTDIFSEADDVTFAEAAAPAGNIRVNGKDYKYLAVNYVFAPADGTVYDVSAKLKVEGKDVSLSVPSVPAKQNWRTNIVGNILTSETDFTVVVDPVFGGDEDIDLVNISNEVSLKALFANGGTATVQADFETSKFSIPAGSKVNLNLNGKTITVKGDSRGIASTINGELTISGDGYFGDPTGEYVGYLFYLAAGSKLNIEGNAVFQCGLSCIQLSGEGAVANIAGGEWIGGAYGGKYWTINKIDSYRETTSVNITGGKFYEFNPADAQTENPAENWVADGYKATKILDYWYVTKDTVAPVVPASGQDELDGILAEGAAADVKLAAGTYTLPTSIADGVSITGQTGTEVIDGSETAKVTAKNFSVSNVVVKGSGAVADGSSLAIQGSNSSVSNCKFENGRQNTYGSDLSVSQPAGSVTTISGCDFRKSGFRGVMIWDTGAEVKIDNCLFDNTYPFNCDAGTGKITVTDSELKGWTSYTNTIEIVSFTNCKFGKSADGYAYLVPYCKTVVKDCTFSSDFLVSPSGSATFTIEFINCRYEDGTAITSAIMDTDGVNKNANWIIDGQSSSY